MGRIAAASAWPQLLRWRHEHSAPVKHHAHHCFVRSSPAVATRSANGAAWAAGPWHRTPNGSTARARCHVTLTTSTALRYPARRLLRCAFDAICFYSNCAVACGRRMRASHPLRGAGSAALPLHLAECLREVADAGPAERGPCDREVVALCSQAGARSAVQQLGRFS